MKIRIAYICALFFGLLACRVDELPTAREAKLELPSTPYEYFVGVRDELPTLGRVLFYDRQLSINNSISCSSCHKQSLAFSDNVAFSMGFESRLTSRNSMPIQDLGGGLILPIEFHMPGDSLPHNFIENQVSLFWDGREKSLNSMVLRPIVNHVEMGINDLDALTKKVANIPYYQDLFTQAYGSPEVTTQRVADALSWFIRSIKSDQTKFDEHQSRGESLRRLPDGSFVVIPAKPLLTPKELEGEQLFFRKYNCNSCHQVQTPDGYSFFGGGFANIGLDQEYEDNGLQKASHLPEDAGKFKIPSLRNVALTAPYMHDGRFSTLEEVVDHYKDGIANHPNLDFRLRNNEGPMRIPIADAEKQAIIAFLNTLTDMNMIRDPKLSNPFKTN